jgi:hypothetical protein
MRWSWGAAAVVAVAVAVACGQGTGDSEVVPPRDVRPDAGADAGSDAGVDAGKADAGVDAGVDGGTDGGTDAGTDAGVLSAPWHVKEVKLVDGSAGWRFATETDGLPGSVMGASADETGNVWVAGGTAGLFVQRSGVGRFQRYTIADGLHPYGYLPGGAPADRNPSLSETPVLSVSGGPGSSGFVGYGGKANCEDEWDKYQDDHARTDPSIYKSGDADRVVLNGGGINVAHYDIFSGPGVVGNEPAGREKLCWIYRIVWQRGSRYVWFGANHGFALGFADYGGNPTCNGNPGCSGNYEHVHPAINDKNGYFITDNYYGIAIDPLPHPGKDGTQVFDVWFGGLARTTRFRFGETGGDYWAAQPLTELYATSQATAKDISTDLPAQAAYWNRMDIWPDPIGERDDPAHGNWKSTEPNFKNPSDWVFDNVTGIAVLQNGDAFIGSFTNGIRIVDHDGKFRADVTPAVLGKDAVLPTKAVGAMAKDPTDESIWVGYRDEGWGLTRIKQDGTVLHYRGLGRWTNSAVWDIQVQPATATSKRRILVAFRSGAVGTYDGE